jgi:hypothetical protein
MAHQRLLESHGPSRNWDKYFEQQGIGKDGTALDVAQSEQLPGEATVGAVPQGQEGVKPKKTAGLGSLQSRAPSKNWDALLPGENKALGVGGATGEERSQDHWNKWYTAHNQQHATTKTEEEADSADWLEEIVPWTITLAIIASALYNFLPQIIQEQSTA